MISFQALDEYLAFDVPDDYWSDEGVVHGLGLASELTPAGWTSLASTWRDRSPSWQARCADVLSDVAEDQSVAILGAMLGSPVDRVASGAADSLRVLLDANPTIVPDAAVLAQAEALASRVQGLQARSLDQLIGHLKSRG